MSDTHRTRIVVMTGATAGIGEHAARRLAALPDTRILIGARGSDRSGPAGAELIPLDLASLPEVRAFADTVKQRLGDAGIDMLVLNAGLQSANLARSSDGFELTFAVNHLAHYLLARLLLPHLAEGARLVITTSDTHDPEIFRFAPRTLDPQALAHPRNGGFAAGGRSYPASKLCNVLTARSLAALDEVRARDIRVIAYNPGMTRGTLLARGAPLVLRGLMRVMFPVVNLLGRFRSQYHVGTPERAGSALAELAAGTVAPPADHVYASLVRGELTFPNPSELARNDEARDLLWRESATMVSLPA